MLLIGIAGGTGSGKTTFTNKVMQRLTHTGVGVLHQDSYYLPELPLHLKTGDGVNYDHPDAFDWGLLRDHLVRFKKSEQVASPVYDFKKSQRMPERQNLGPFEVILVEGILTLWEPLLRAIFDIKIFLHVDADIRFIRRLHRDVKERGRTLDSVIRQYYDTVRPMYHEYLDPTKAYADLVVGEETDIAADILAAKVNTYLSQTPGAK